ncbi:MAG: glycosyltransferase family 4 protein [Candidatus Omnitrophica bacterium]|nr:glycosyltransferase family 4 protein [Candidatus Omnitrophota bacterium]MBU1127475.1 glycosyltransferase family 4 protein [Candidatus Omnitrophota bacterium]MBU1785051.1 glycosyltransferase family 4 protein [Candidatus Omnitrophota bacterium]MBU1851883.1 glycosyltransferase family 4 protein [Candidatus Omnitrophota bacterium]
MRKSGDKKMNIAHLHWGFPPIIGGVETHLTIILPEMVKQGHNVSLLTGSVEGVDGLYVYEGATIHRTPLMDLNWLAKRGLAGLDEEIYQVFNTFLETTKPDIIHVHNMHYFSPVHAHTLSGLAKERGIPLIVTAHNVWDDVLFMDLTHKIDWTHIIAVSHFIKKEIIGIGVDDRKITVIHHGIDQDKFNPAVNPEKILKKYPQLKNKKVIFHPARIGMAKGCDVSIKAINIVKRIYPDIMLVLAGSKNIVDWAGSQQKDIAYLVKLIKHFGLTDNILIDSYTLDEVSQIYSVADVCLYPSSGCEPFGLTMLEAMASEKPIIVTKMGGMPEIISDGINGFVIPVKDFELLAAKINNLLEDEALRRRLGYTGRQMVEAQYTKEHVTANTLAVYKRFL